MVENEDGRAMVKPFDPVDEEVARGLLRYLVPELPEPKLDLCPRVVGDLLFPKLDKESSEAAS